MPEFPKKTPDLIYLCLPNNPTGTTIKKEQLQSWVDYANRVGAVIIYDAAYEAYISQVDVAHSIYECEGAKSCAIEIRSFSKNAGFTGVRLGFTVVQGGTAQNTTGRLISSSARGKPYIQKRAKPR